MTERFSEQYIKFATQSKPIQAAWQRRGVRKQSWKECYTRLKVAGLCTKCRKPRGDNGTKTLCRACADKGKILRDQRRSRLNASGLCRDCGGPKNISETCTRCVTCAEKARREAQGRRNKRKAIGICKNCDNLLDQGGTLTMCRCCAEKQRRESRARRYEYRATSRCVKCGQVARADRTTCAICGEKDKQSSQGYRKTHRAEQREYHHRWYAIHKEQRQEYNREWAEKNRGYVREQARLRALRKRDADGICNARQLQARIDYYGGLCYICQERYEHIDHVIPLARKGTNWPANLRPICAKHNLMKRDKPLAEFMQQLK